MTTQPVGEGADGSQTLERGLAVLLELSRHPEGMTTAQLAAACGLHRSITYRLLVSLHRTGFAARDAAGSYTLGPTASELVDRTRPSLREVAEPVLHQLAREVDATASLVEAIGGHAVTTVVAEPPTDGPRFSYRLGNRDPLDRGAGGLAALASGPPVQGEPDRVARIRDTGHVATHQELHPGAYGLAAPLPGWGVLASISIVTGRGATMTSGLEPLRRAADAIAKHARSGT